MSDDGFEIKSKIHGFICVLHWCIFRYPKISRLFGIYFLLIYLLLLFFLNLRGVGFTHVASHLMVFTAVYYYYPASMMSSICHKEVSVSSLWYKSYIFSKPPLLFASLIICGVQYSVFPLILHMFIINGASSPLLLAVVTLNFTWPYRLTTRVTILCSPKTRLLMFPLLQLRMSLSVIPLKLLMRSRLR